jgi:hypothetical protein
MNKEITGFTAGNFDLLHPEDLITKQTIKQNPDILKDE